MRTAKLTLLGVLLLGALGPLRSASAGPLDDAKTYFEAGSQAYEAGDYVTAIRSLEESYRLAPKPPIAFSLAQAYRKQYVVDQKLPLLRRAVDLYRKYIEDVKQGGRREDAVQHLSTLQPELTRLEGAGGVLTGPLEQPRKTQLMVLSLTKGSQASIGGGELGRVPLTREVEAGEHKIHVEAPGYFAQDLDGVALDGQLVVVKVDLKPQPALLRVRAKSGADISIDGRLVGSTPLRQPVQAAAGKHFLAVTMRGHHPFTRELTVERGRELAVDAPLSRTSQRRASFWVLGGASLLLIGGGVTTTLALTAQGDAEDLLDRKASVGLTDGQLREYNKKIERRDTMVTASYVLYGSAAVAGVTGILLYLMDTPRVQAPIEPMLGTLTIGARISRRF